jgi:hypothetical protein
MQLYPLKLVTVIAEIVLKDTILAKILELGATGYTYAEVAGFGSRGARNQAGDENMQIKIICPANVAEAILTYMSHNYFENYACIAWVTDVSVVRGAHYAQK